MMMKQDTTTVTVCRNCDVEERRLLHHVRHRGIFRRLCTTCVLRLHPQSFCPTCFLVYDRSPPNDAVTCFKCYSSSHPNCVAAPASSKTPYVCPSCVNPNAPIFSLKKVKHGDGAAGGEACRSMDKKAARVLLTAAKIAAISMSKAAVAARAEAERRAKEAAYTRKRAREALEHLVYLMAKEKKSHKVGIGSATSSVINNQGGADKMDSSREVLEALNAVELKEKEREILQGIKAENSMSEVISNEVPMEVEDNERLGISSVSNNENERPGDSSNLDENKSAEGEKVSNVLPSVPLVDQPQSMESSHDMEENFGSQQ